MANRKLFFCILFLAICKQAFFSDEDNMIEVESEDSTFSPINEIKNELLNEENLKNIGGAIQNFMQSDSGKQLGDILVNTLKDSGGNALVGQLLQGATNLLLQQQQTGVGDPKSKDSSGQDVGLSPELMGNLLNMLIQSNAAGGIDIGSIMQMVMNLAGQNSAAGYMNILSNVLTMVGNSFVGPEAEKRAAKHAEHAGLFPPLVEKLHLYIDHFVHSEMGAAFFENTGANKALKVFADENGNFSYPKFVELIENHSFRKHWISMMTKKVATIISYFADPLTQKKFMTTFTLFINNYLKAQGVPKPSLFDPALPTESLVAVVNFFSKKYLGQKIEAKKYIQPMVLYIQDLLRIAEQRGLVGTGLDSDELSHKIADTINLEIIEPVIRVNRAYRFATQVPKCDRYVMCLVNQAQPDEVESIPGLKQSLSRLASVVAAWFISDRGFTSFWSLYHVIMEENMCQARFLDDCHEFHIQEMKVTTEYIHNEL